MLSIVYDGLRHLRACTVTADESVGFDGRQPDNAAHDPARTTPESSAQARP
jgi:hypothetical protein